MNVRMMAVAGLAAILLAAGTGMADTFGMTGTNQFTIDFVTISGATNPTSGYGIVNHDYRMGKFEITNAQWNKFKASLGVIVTGTPSSAYDSDPNYKYWTDANIPTYNVSWYEAAQFVNWLNTSTGHQAAYKFTGTQGTGDYALATWSTAEADNGSNLYRHKDAFYYLPTEDEWVKAAYWNGTSLQTYATKAGEMLFQGKGFNGGWNYSDDYGYDLGPDGIDVGPWAVGSGSQELNGTYDMMGNVWERMESPYSDPNYGTASNRGIRGGAYGSMGGFESFYRGASSTNAENPDDGFRVASEVPEPASLALLTLGGLALLKRRRRRR